jgi:hypothetical protein
MQWRVRVFAGRRLRKDVLLQRRTDSGGRIIAFVITYAAISA